MALEILVKRALILSMNPTEKARARLLDNPFPVSPWIEVGDEVITIRAGYTDVLVRLLRWVPGAKWHRSQRQWSVPLSGAESLRSILPEVLRLSELTSDGDTPLAVKDGPQSATEAFKDAARLMFGIDWQGQVAEALGRDEVAMARWLAGEQEVEAPAEMLAALQGLLRRRAAQFLGKADALNAHTQAQ